ncbi:hypothetical protein [Brachybacterium sp. ACRRE]|uniref:hypothetical protein n=1 Tax=Brachybacterium sp. ACRRE TaxID=2918184 RepID=UPI001EF35492|nr:hypothetical protein [Brachybacterium sp. ACRRE]MCG7308324.1 hypothetical protein [Brachybacterium sp. ACRRE]
MILPAGTFWEVVAVVDAEHPMARRDSRDVFTRVRTIQMVEIGVDDLDSAHPIRMTATEAELDALASGPS